MTTTKQIQARSTPDEIAAGIKWERVKIHHGVLTQEFDQAAIHAFIMLVRDDGAWSVHAREGGKSGRVVVQGESMDVSAARRDATLALLGACEAAQFFFSRQQTFNVVSFLKMVDVCDETARIIRSSATSLIPED
jgi:hypothetical protein